jgi:hypothetical protein
MLLRARVGHVLAGIAFIGLLLSCGSKPASGGALAVTVIWEDAVTARCFRVFVQADGAIAPVRSGPIARPTDRSSVVVAVYQDELTAHVGVQARGFSDEGCTLETSPLEASAIADATFVAGETVSVPVKVLAALRPDGGTDGGADAGAQDGGASDGGADGGVDRDGDGSPAGVDCDDTDPLRFPGNPEVCNDRIDNDCDLQPDCMDTACASMGCGRPAAASAVCQGGVCVERTCDDSVSNDDDALIDCADSDCGGRSCPNAGTCVALVCSTTVEVCNDGVNNDSDLLIDCADPDCRPDAGCTDGDACTSGERCQLNGTCGNGTPLACAAAPVCFVSLGCDAGLCIDQRADAGTSCSDGVRCTTNDRCDGDGGCVGDLVVCPNPGACFVGACAEADGGCGAVPDPGAVCTDNDACTDNDTCADDGGCAGTPTVCPPPEECQSASPCDPVMGCTYTPRTGQACDGGTCNALGQCQPSASGFPYVPSNFTEAEIATVPATSWTVTCATTVNTVSADGGVEILRSCGDALPSYTYVPQRDAGLEAVVLVASDFTLTSGVTLRAEGARPLIIAVRGSATVAGTINVDGEAGSTAAAGAGRRCGTGVGGAGTTGTYSGGGGGGAFGANASNGGPGGDGTAAGAGGAASGNVTLTPLRGGCPGGTGGGAPVTPAGRGGGAVQISAVGAVTVSGAISAGGGGGGGAPPTTRGGGGGGSGGGILLEGANITVSGVLAANAGGGGEGSAGGLDPGTGQAGTLGLRSIMRAPGGNGGNSCGGNGGWGAAQAGASTAGGAPPGGLCFRYGGGGGGGGSVGRIRLNASASCTLSGTISPRQTGVGTGCP